MWIYINAFFKIQRHKIEWLMHYKKEFNVRNKYLKHDFECGYIEITYGYFTVKNCISFIMKINLIYEGVRKQKIFLDISKIQ